MPWFFVDDGLNSHPKPRQAGLAAMGLWVIAGSYSMQHLTDGFVPDWLVKGWPNGTRLAARLVEANLWSRTVKDGISGYLFHEWDLRQRTKAEVEEERRKERARKAEERAKKRAATESSGRTSSRTTTATPVVTPPVTPPGSPDGCPETPALPLPTKPSTTQKSSTSGAPQRGTRLPQDWQPTDVDLRWAAERHAGINVDVETEKFLNHFRAKSGRDATKLDWSATWKNWIIKAGEFSQQRPTRAPDRGPRVYPSRRPGILPQEYS